MRAVVERCQGTEANGRPRMHTLVTMGGQHQVSLELLCWCRRLQEQWSSGTRCTPFALLTLAHVRMRIISDEVNCDLGGTGHLQSAELPNRRGRPQGQADSDVSDRPAPGGCRCLPALHQACRSLSERLCPALVVFCLVCSDAGGAILCTALATAQLRNAGCRDQLIQAQYFKVGHTLSPTATGPVH